MEPGLKELALDVGLSAFKKSEQPKSRSLKIDRFVFKRVHLYLRRKRMGNNVKYSDKKKAQVVAKA